MLSFFSVIAKLTCTWGNGKSGQGFKTFCYAFTTVDCVFTKQLTSLHFHLLGKIPAVALTTVSTLINFEQLLAFKQNTKQKDLDVV